MTATRRRGRFENDRDICTSSDENGVWRRNHLVIRGSIFTPSGLPGLPKRPSGLSRRRTTEGSEEVITVDARTDFR